MVQTLATLLFLLLAGAGVSVIAASLIDDWGLMTRALGFGGAGLAPLPQVRNSGARQPRLVRVTRPLDARRAAA